jgi:hypothetical protein
VTDLDLVIDCAPSGTGWTCTVIVGGPGGATTHEVTVQATDLRRLDPGADTPADLVRRSFVFLLEREPKTSILRTFDLTVIGRHFPDWARTIRA